MIFLFNSKLNGRKLGFNTPLTWNYKMVVVVTLNSFRRMETFRNSKES